MSVQPESEHTVGVLVAMMLESLLVIGVMAVAVEVVNVVILVAVLLVRPAVEFKPMAA